MGAFVARYRSIAEPLFGRRFTGKDGLPESEQSDLGYEVPEALRDFFAVVGRFGPIMSAHNRFSIPRDFTDMDEKLVFCEENQVVVLWGYDEDQGWQSDPPVYQGVNNDEVEWYLESARCSDFLAGMIYWQALNGGLPQIASCSVGEGIGERARAWPLVWEDESSQIFSRGSAVFSITRSENDVAIQAAGLRVADLNQVWSSLGFRRGGPEKGKGT